MEPIRTDLHVIPGTTYRDVVRLMQPAYAYQSITAIGGAPLRLTVPGHGFSTAWAVWVRGAVGMPALNREPRREAPHRVTVVDADTLEINALSATGLNPTGGELIHLLPVDLTGAQVVMAWTRNGVPLFSLSLGAGLVEQGPGSVERTLSPSQTSQLWAGDHYTMDVQYSNGDVIRYFEGQMA